MDIGFGEIVIVSFGVRPMDKLSAVRVRTAQTVAYGYSAHAVSCDPGENGVDLPSLSNVGDSPPTACGNDD